MLGGKKKQFPHLLLSVLSFVPSMQFFIKGKDLLINLKSVFFFLVFPNTSELDIAK